MMVPHCASSSPLRMITTALLLKAVLGANLPPPMPEDFTGYQVVVVVVVVDTRWWDTISCIVVDLVVIFIGDLNVVSIECDHQVFSLTPHSPSQVSWLLELR